MRIGRILLTVLAATLAGAPLAAAQRGPAGTPKPAIEKVTPAALETGRDPVEVVVTGTGFAAKAVVRIRRSADKGGGLDYAATVDGPTSLRLRVPAELLDRVGTLELRVKNPDGATSDWAPVEIKARAVPGGGGDIGSRKPVVERVSPTRLEAGSRNLHVTVYGRDIADGAVAEFRAGGAKAEARGQLVNGALVVLFPDELLARAQAVIMQVHNPGGGVSDQVRLDVVEPQGTPPTPNTNDPFIAQLEPQSIDMRGAKSRTVQVMGRGIDRAGAKVLMRPEGSSETGQLVPVIERSTATNGVVLNVELTPNMVAASRAYELRVVNPNGRQSNWVRLEVVSNPPGVGNTGAVVDAKFPESLTLTAVNATVPVELGVDNTGRTPVRLASFALVTPDGVRVPVEGSLEVPAESKRNIRLEAPAPLGAGAGSRTGAKMQFALEYKVTLVSSRNPTFDGRAPDEGFATVMVRNEIGLEEIGREYVASQTANGPEGWRFFKTANEANAGEGKAADFYLFAEPFAARQKIPTEELYNYRLDDGTPANRGLFYLVLRNNEVSAIDARTRERGTRLGYVASAEAPGLVPLYRWALSDGRRTVNHYLTTEKDAAKLPRQMQRGGWKLDTVVGYVVPRS
jgi:hypothetical protein